MTKKNKFIGLAVLFILLVVVIPLLIIEDFRFVAVIATIFAVAVGLKSTAYIPRLSLWEGPLMLISIFLPLIIGAISWIAIEEKKNQRGSNLFG